MPSLGFSCVILPLAYSGCLTSVIVVCCSRRGPGLAPGPHMMSHNPLTTLLGHLMPSGLHRHQACLWTHNILVGKTHTHKIKINEILKHEYVWSWDKPFQVLSRLPNTEVSDPGQHTWLILICSPILSVLLWMDHCYTFSSLFLAY